MKDEPEDTWELAQQLELLAKLLKMSPRFVFTKGKEELIQLVPTVKELLDYSKKTVKDLRKLCKERDIKIPSRSRKADIIRLLQEHNEGIRTIDKIITAFSDKTE